MAEKIVASFEGKLRLNMASKDVLQSSLMNA